MTKCSCLEFVISFLEIGLPVLKWLFRRGTLIWPSSNLVGLLGQVLLFAMYTLNIAPSQTHSCSFLNAENCRKTLHLHCLLEWARQHLCRPMSPSTPTFQYRK